MFKNKFKVLFTIFATVFISSVTVSATDFSASDIIIYEDLPENVLNDDNTMNAIQKSEEYANTLKEQPEDTNPNARFFEPAPFYDEGIYSIKLKDSNLFLDVIRKRDVNGAGVHAWGLNFSTSRLLNYGVWLGLVMMSM